MKYSIFLKLTAFCAIVAACQKPANEVPAPEPEPEPVPDFIFSADQMRGDGMDFTLTPSDSIDTYFYSCIKKEKYTDDQSLIDADLTYMERLAEALGVPVSQVVGDTLNTGKLQGSVSQLFPETDYYLYAYGLDATGNTGKVSRFEFKTVDGFGFDADILQAGPDSLKVNIRITDDEVEYYPLVVLTDEVNKIGGPDAYVERYMSSVWAQFSPKFKGDILYKCKLTYPGRQYDLLCFRYMDKKVVPPVYCFKYFTEPSE